MPPWAILAIQPVRHPLDEVAGLGDLQRLPQLLVGGSLVAVPQVAGHRAGEQVRLLRHQPDRRRQRRRVELADVNPADQERPPVTSISRGMRLTSVVLPLPVPPMIAVVWPGRALRLMSWSTGCSAPG